MFCKDTFSGFSIVTPRAPEMDLHSHGVASTRFDQKITNSSVTTLLTRAACEWFLIFLMFVDAFLSYLLVWFANYCKLQIPCFLCSKLHPPSCWRLLLCRSHRSEVSSLISCQIHDNNLADSRGMCDDCLLSFTKKTAPNPDMHRLLLGKVGFDLILKSDPAHPRLCSCCDKPWRSRHSSQRLIQLGFQGRNSISKPNIPTPRPISRRGSGNLKKTRAQKASVVTSSYVSGHGDGRAHLGYRELKITSDSDSEFPFSDDDSFVPVMDFNIDISNRSSHESLSEGQFEENISKCKQCELRDNKNKNTHYEASMTELIRQEDIQQQPVRADKNVTVFSEIITLGDASPSPSSSLVQEDNAGSVSQKENEARASKNSSPSEGKILSTHSEKDTSDRSNQQATNCLSGDIDASSWENQSQAHDSNAFTREVSDSVLQLEGCEEVVEPKESDFVVENDESGSIAQHTSHEKDGDNEDFESMTSSEVSGSAVNDSTNGDTAAEEHSDNREDEIDDHSETWTSNNVSGPALEDHSDKEEGSAKGESEPFTSWNNSSNEESSVDHGDKESSKVNEALSTSNETPVLKHSASVESFGSVNSDFEGESLVGRLKQQLENDRKCLKDLQKELEEERNASAIATNEAMAMITRLQEEKAALHMEALQYLRMMDEQAEHDVDALEKANDLLADKETELQDLEMELEYYRLKYPDEPRDEIIAAMGMPVQEETKATSTTDENNDKTPTDTNDSYKPSFTNSSSLEMEKERLHISQRLRNLEKTLYHFTEGRLPESAENGSSDDRESLTRSGSLETQENSLKEEDNVSTVNGESLGEENNIGKPNKESNSLPTERMHSSHSQEKKEWNIMEKEISELKKRLDTLKADHDFLEQVFATIEKGEAGVELIEGIARELQELRNLGITRR